MVQEYKQGASSASGQMEGQYLQGSLRITLAILMIYLYSYCDNIDIAGETEVLCNVDCPVDCSLSPWSAWDISSCQCGLVINNITRHRSICTITRYCIMNQILFQICGCVPLSCRTPLPTHTLPKQALSINYLLWLE